MRVPGRAFLAGAAGDCARAGKTQKAPARIPANAIDLKELLISFMIAEVFRKKNGGRRAAGPP
jgi:hypothetical protein